MSTGSSKRSLLQCVAILQKIERARVRASVKQVHEKNLSLFLSNHPELALNDFVVSNKKLYL
jgi:hypothetical protein